MVLTNADDIREVEFIEGLDERTTLTVEGISEDKFDREALLDECTDKVAGDARLTLIGIIRFEPPVGLEDLEEEGKGDRVKDTVGSKCSGLG
jgi:hypothetical protein